jgi:hypothetical protein
MAKLHYKYLVFEPQPEAKIACGIFISDFTHTTKNKDFVTCNNCLRAIESNYNPELKKQKDVKSNNGLVCLR